MGDVTKALKRGEHLIAHAPTGIGKTVAVLSPTLECALKKNKTVFFLTPKHTQHVIVIDTLKKVILVGLGASKDDITRSLQHIIQSIGDELSVALIGKEGIVDQRYIMDTFSITNLEIDSHSPKSEADVMELLEKLVIERIALFAI